MKFSILTIFHISFVIFTQINHVIIFYSITINLVHKINSKIIKWGRTIE